ncbi:hypothetical protein HAX54_004982 [Datura stramonium]|uniref:HTH myb-type domain-containing protein n=1 Tax=Datura stramonium TaxID=4076 RepID=A0ABS8T7X9_DATST|nr:hypothetical protein [Datura stramonium]
MATNNSKKDMDRVKGPWSPEEDELLQQLVQKHTLEIDLLLVNIFQRDLANLAGCGVVISYLLRGSAPFTANEGNELTDQILQNKQPPLKRSVNAGFRYAFSGFHFTPGSPSGSDSDSSLYVTSSSQLMCLSLLLELVASFLRRLNISSLLMILPPLSVFPSWG